MLKYEWSEEEARRAIREVSYEEGILYAIKSLMHKQKLTAMQAMDILDIPVSAQSTYINRLNPT